MRARQAGHQRTRSPSAHASCSRCRASCSGRCRATSAPPIARGVWRRSSNCCAACATARSIGRCSSTHRLDRPEMLDLAYAEVRFSDREIVKLRGVNALPGHGFERRREVEVAVGCSVLITAEALRAIGAFNEAYFAYHEDVDWSL